MSNGAALLGHDHPRIKEAVLAGVEAGIITAAETPYHEQLAATICEIIPAAERVRFSTVGSEVTLVALRIARQATGRTQVPQVRRPFPRPDRALALQPRRSARSTTARSCPRSGGVPEIGGDDVVMIPFNDRRRLRGGDRARTATSWRR